MIEKYKKIIIDKPSLEDCFPPGIFDDYSRHENDNSLYVLRIIEELIKENTTWNLYILRNWLFQTFAYRNFDDENQFYDIKNSFINDDFIYQILKTITPNHYHNLIKRLSIVECEIFLKNYVSAHQTWGKPEGLLELVKSFIENALQRFVKVKINTDLFTKKTITENIISRLKLKNSTLGQNLILGNEFQSSAEKIEVLVGPINYSELDTLNSFGYAEDINPSQKILDIAKLCEPYFLNIKIKYLLATDGFVLGKSLLGKDRLGISYKI